MKTGGDRDIAQQMVGGVGEIGNRDRLALGGGRAEHAGALVDGQMRAFGGLVDADRLRQVELLLRRIIAVDQHRIGMGDFERAGRHRRQYGVEIERGRNRAADFLENLKFIDRLRQIAGALLDLGFKAGIGFMQLAGHAVELIGEFFQLVLGVDVDAMAEIALAETARAAAQCRDRDQHAAGEHGAGEARHHQPEHDQEHDPRQLIADRRQRLGRRLLEEHVPAEFRHGAGGGQHRIAVGVAARGHGVAVRRQARGDLRQRRDVVADRRALGRTCQHLAVRIDHIGEGGLADLRVAEEIRQETKIDIGDGDAGIVAGMRYRDRHEGLPVPEKGRRVADAPGDGFGEFRVVG